MNLNFATVVLVLAATATGLIAGLFYAYSCSVNWGLAKLDDAGYIAAMQNINTAIINPLFMASFIGTLLLLPLSAYLHYSHPVSMRFWLLAAAVLVYAVGVFGVTVAGNVPLNNALAAFNLDSSTPEQITAMRVQFEAPWNTLHTIRTIANVGSLVLVILGCLWDEPVNG